MNKKNAFTAGVQLLQKMGLEMGFSGINVMPVAVILEVVIGQLLKKYGLIMYQVSRPILSWPPNMDVQ
jgi:hypothetical protein